MQIKQKQSIFLTQLGFFKPPREVTVKRRLTLSISHFLLSYSLNL